MAHRFKITKFKNPSGVDVFRVSGTLDGKQIRQNFKSRPEAVARRQELEVERLNGESEGQTVWTTLTHDQNRDAIAAVNLLKRSGSTKSLAFAVNYFLQHYKESAETMQVEAAVDEYLEERKQDLARGYVSAPQEESLRKEMRHFRSAFEGRLVGELRPDEIREYLDKSRSSSTTFISAKTLSNRRGYLSKFFKVCQAKKYVAENPIADVPQPKLRKSRGIAETLSAEQAAEMMAWLESYRGEQGKDGTWTGVAGCMVPYFLLTLFAGIRPDYTKGEIRKLRADDVRMDTNVIMIDPRISKIRERRTIFIQPNVRLWLERFPLAEYPILPQGFKRMIPEVRKHWKLGHDVLRHTFISMTVGAFRSVGDAALQAGNSEFEVRRDYLNLKSVEEADRFWRIVPQGAELPALEKRDGVYVEIPDPIS